MWVRVGCVGLGREVGWLSGVGGVRELKGVD